MSAAPLHALPPRATFTGESPLRLTVDQYHELIRSGDLAEDDPVELLDGVLIYTVPKNAPCSTNTNLVRREVERRLPDSWHYQPITLADDEPEPDGAVVRGRIEDYTAAHPKPAAVALVIEVSDTSLGRDRGPKLRSYARARIPAYWIVNLDERQVEAHAGPTTPADGDPTYARRDVYRPGEAVPLDLPGVAGLAAVPVDALLPPAA